MEMKKKLASVLTVIMLACSLPWQAQAAAPIVSNKPHKAPVATPPAVSKAAVPEPAAVKADTAAKPAAEVKAPKQAKPEKKARKPLLKSLKKRRKSSPRCRCSKATGA